MNYLKLAICIGLIAIGFGIAWSWQGARLDAVKTEMKVCKDANAENTATIDALKAEIAKGNKACDARLKSKDKALKRIQEIDKMRGKDEKNPDSGNPLRDALNGMFGDN